MEHKSGCRTFRVTASELVGRYQGSGAEAIRSIFDRAKRVKANKGVMIVIDKLESLSPANYTDANLARENQNTLAQLRSEYDNCERNNEPIFIVATCNKLWLIDEGTRGRLDCIKFSFPSVYEFFKNKLTPSTQVLDKILKNIAYGLGRALGVGLVIGVLMIFGLKYKPGMSVMLGK